MPTYDFGNLLVVNAHSFTDWPVIQKLTNCADVKPINKIISAQYDGQLLYEILGLAMQKLSTLPKTNHFRVYQLTGTPTSQAYEKREDFISALTLNHDDFTNLMACVFKVDIIDQIESLLQRYLAMLHQAGADPGDFASYVEPVKQTITKMRLDHYDHNLNQLSGHLANQW